MVVLLLVLLVFGLIRKVTALESDLAKNQRDPSYVGGPPLGAPAPSVAVDQTLTSALNTEHGRVVLFLSSSCGACRRLAGELRTENRTATPIDSLAQDFDLIVVTDPNGRDAYSDLDANAMVVQSGGELSRAWSVPATPFAVAVDSNGVVRGSAFANTRAKLVELARILTASVGPGAPQRSSTSTTVGGAEQFN